MTHRFRGRAKWLLKLAASVVLVTIVLERADLRSVLGALGGVGWRWIAVAAIAPIAATGIVVARWRLLLAAGGARIAAKLLFASFLVASMVRQFLPTTIGGDVMRAYDTWRAGASRTLSISALFTERLVGFLSLLLIGTTAAALPNPISTAFPSLLLWFAALTVGAAGFTWLVFTRDNRWLDRVAARLDVKGGRVSRTVRWVFSMVRAYPGHGVLLGRVLLWSFAMQFSVIFFYWLIARALGLPVGFAALCIVVPIATIVMMVPITVMGVGLREGAFVVLLGLYGVAAGPAVAFAWIEYGIYLLVAAIGGIVYAVRRDPVEGRPSFETVAKWGETASEHAVKQGTGA